MLHETARRRWRVSEAGFYFDIQSCQTWRRLDRKGNIFMRIGVCDDIREVREQLTDLVKSLYPDAMVVCYKDGGQVLEEKNLPDILFLDIQMAGINGMETAKQLRRTGKKMIIIFVTALEEYVFDAFDVSVILNNALQNAIENVESEEQPYISVLSYQKKHAWILEIRNPFNGELCWDAENALPLASKEKADSHGYGLVNIRRIAGKYFGDLDVVCHDGEFCLSVLLMTE